LFLHLFINDTVSFGQAVPEDRLRESYRHAEQCDLCIVLGSSLVVYPAALVPRTAAEKGSRLLIVNRDETPLDSLADLVIRDSVCSTLPDLVAV
jgi:NAD-dependent deacetylase